MNTLDVTKAVDRLFLSIRQQPLSEQTGLTVAAREAIEHELDDTLRRVCYQRMAAGETTEAIADSLRTTNTTVNRHIRQYAESHGLRPLVRGPVKGDEILVVAPRT